MTQTRGYGKSYTRNEEIENTLKAMVEIMSGISEQSNLFEFILDQVILVLNAENGCIVQLKPDGSLDFPAVRYNWEGHNHPSKDPISSSVLQNMIKHREPVLTTDAMVDPRFSGAQSIVKLNLRSILGAPLIFDDQFIGAIYLENRSKSGQFTIEDLDTLEQFSQASALALHNQSLENNS